MNASLADHSQPARVQSGTSALPARRAALPRSWRILKPGRNCWRVAQTRRVAVLVDGGPYFARLEAALRLATREILIVGWDFDGAVRLRPDASPEDSKPLGELLHELVESRPDLEVRILVWSVAVAHAPSDPMPLLFGADWQKHPRIHVKLDTKHPIYAAHHQKIVCIDDAIAFVGGMDLTVDRWDTNRHLANDPLRVSPTGVPYRPVHDIQMLVDGEAASALATLARERWENATGETLVETRGNQDPWPPGLQPHFVQTPVAIARTAPGWRGRDAIRESAMLTADALAAARDCIYIEAQYMTAAGIGDVLVEKLMGETGPEVIVLMTHSSEGLLERAVMGRNRDRLIRRLKHADRFDRLRVLYPVVPGRQGEEKLLVHSKLIIVDDVFLKVGSSNLNNRSIGLDTECDVAIEGTDCETRGRIASIRDQLLAEFLDERPEVVRERAAREGSIVRAIGALNRNPRRLRAFEAMNGAGPRTPVFGTALLDPKQPFAPLRSLGATIAGATRSLLQYLSRQRRIAPALSKEKLGCEE
jgi:phosphatidylserine/phosphatidylglycerophosphate/cardiolipin synthase-like enzyme